MKRILFCFVFSIALLVSGCVNDATTQPVNQVGEDIEPYTQLSSESIKNWEEDIEYLRKELSKKHYNLFFKLSEEDFNTMLNSLLNELPQLTEDQIRIRIAQIIAAIGDTHTYYSRISEINTYSVYPIRTYWFKDGLYVVSADQQYRQYLGLKLLKINDTPIEEIMQEVNTLISHENDVQLMLSNPYLIMNPSILKYFGFANDSSIPVFTFEGPNGAIESVEVSAKYYARTNFISALDGLESKPLYLQKQDWFWHNYDQRDKTLYVQYNNCWDRNLEQLYRRYPNQEIDSLPDFEAFSDELIDIIERNEVNKLIVDLRNNSGGSSPMGTKLVRRISRINKVNQEGKLFVIVGRVTFSSAILNTLDFANMTEAIFFGEPTSGKPNHHGEVQGIELPNSCITIGYSTKYFKYFEKDIDSFIPDYIVEATYEEWNKGVDPVLEAVKAYPNIP